MSRRFLTLLAVAGLLPIASFAGTIDGYDADAIKTALKGKKIVVQSGCLEEPRQNEAIAKLFEDEFSGISEDDSAFRRTVTKAFLEGLAKKAGKRIEFDTTACRTGAKSKMVADLDGHDAMVDGSRIVGTKAYLALGIFLYESPSFWEQEFARKAPIGVALAAGAQELSVGARLSFGIYDPQERLLVYYGSAKAAAMDGYSVMGIVKPEHWEIAARKLGEKIGATIAGLPGR